MRLAISSAVLWTSILVAGSSLAPAPVGAAPSRLEQEVVRVLNAARARPRDFADALQDYRDRFTGDVAHETEGDIGVGTFEGPLAVDQAAAFVSRLGPIGPVAADAALARAAADLADDQARTGAIGHLGSDRSTTSQRVWRYARGRTLVAEIISYGQSSAEAVIRQLVIDDGLPARPHRADVFEPAFRRVGVACRGHPRYGGVCVIDLSGD